MTPDEQEAQSLRYACYYHIAVLRSGNIAIMDRLSHKPLRICSPSEAAVWITELTYTPPPTPSRPTPKPEISVDELLKGLEL